MAIGSCFNIELVDALDKTHIDHFKNQREYGPVIKLLSDKYTALSFSAEASFKEYKATIAKLETHPLSAAYVMMPKQIAVQQQTGNPAVVFDHGGFTRLTKEILEKCDWSVKQRLMSGIARCLSHFHETLGICHGSLSPKMVFWDTQEVKLGIPLDEMEIGDYCSPEYFLSKVAKKESNLQFNDIWSLGTLYYYIFSNGRLFSTGGYSGDADDFSPLGYNEPDLSQTYTWKMLHRYIRLFNETELQAEDIFAARRKQVISKRVDTVYELNRDFLTEQELVRFDNLAIIMFTELLHPDPLSRISVLDLQRKLTKLM
ncbi:hypothetical protein HDE_00929 [Halotydeus destructor]|nr:hypothetical protein HDE_00929 [Halotydeus destructor]